MSKKISRVALSVSLVISFTCPAILFGAASSSDSRLTKKDRLIIGGGLSAGGAFLGCAAANAYNALRDSLPKLSERTQTALVVSGASLVVLAAGHGIAKRLMPMEQVRDMQPSLSLHVVLDPAGASQVDISSSSREAASSSSSSALSSSSNFVVIKSAKRRDAYGEITIESIKDLYADKSQEQLDQKLLKVSSKSFSGQWSRKRYAIAGLVYAGAGKHWVYPLETAIAKLDFYLVKFLLECGADPNVIATSGPLLSICKDNGIAKLLCMFGANPNTEFRGESILFKALRPWDDSEAGMEEGAEKIKILVESGANVNFARGGDTVLMAAAQSSKPLAEKQRIIALLLRAKAKIHIKNAYGRTAGDILTVIAHSLVDPLQKMQQLRLANLINSYNNQKSTLQERIILAIVLDAYSFDEDVREHGQRNIQVIRAMSPQYDALVDQFHQI